MTRRLTLMLLFALCASVVMGGDIATFENLGFNAAGSVFVFGQYGLQADSAHPFAEIFAVDVASNSFLPNGQWSIESTKPLSLGQDGRGAFYSILGNAQSLLSSRGVDHLATGRPIYILVDGNTPKARLSFRDFNTNTRYEIQLIQGSRGSGESVSASFSIELRLTKADDSVQTITLGRPGYFREGVQDYRITQVLVGPDEDTVVVVVEKRGPDGSIRYMVETSRL